MYEVTGGSQAFRKAQTVGRPMGIHWDIGLRDLKVYTFE